MPAFGEHFCQKTDFFSTRSCYQSSSPVTTPNPHKSNPPLIYSPHANHKKVHDDLYSYYIQFASTKHSHMKTRMCGAPVD
ncbi:hypothetical protein JOB18_022319, partial [Solea senegalensis]